jgi:hypothetical protein
LNSTHFLSTKVRFYQSPDFPKCILPNSFLPKSGLAGMFSTKFRSTKVRCYQSPVFSKIIFYQISFYQSPVCFKMGFYQIPFFQSQYRPSSFLEQKATQKVDNKITWKHRLDYLLILVRFCDGWTLRTQWREQQGITGRKVISYFRTPGTTACQAAVSYIGSSIRRQSIY